MATGVSRAVAVGIKSKVGAAVLATLLATGGAAGVAAAPPAASRPFLCRPRLKLPRRRPLRPHFLLGAQHLAPFPGGAARDAGGALELAHHNAHAHAHAHAHACGERNERDLSLMQRQK